MKLLLLSSIFLLSYTVFASYTCVPLDLMSVVVNPVSDTPIGTISVNGLNVNCNLYLRKYNSTREIYETSLRDSWVDRHKHLLYRHFKLSYPNYDIPILDTSQFKVFIINDLVYLIKPLKITPEDISEILNQSNCTSYDDIDVHFHENYISHLPEHRRNNNN